MSELAGTRKGRVRESADPPPKKKYIGASRSLPRYIALTISATSVAGVKINVYVITVMLRDKTWPPCWKMISVRPWIGCMTSPAVWGPSADSSKVGNPAALKTLSPELVRVRLTRSVQVSEGCAVCMSQPSAVLTTEHRWQGMQQSSPGSCERAQTSPGVQGWLWKVKGGEGGSLRVGEW